MQTLIHLLKEISDCKRTDYQVAFGEAAELLINTVELVAGDTRYTIKELEFYFFSSEHKDPFMHGVERHYRFGEWYFHRFKTSETYTHTRRGLDLTFGNSETECPGGILIRGIQEVGEDKAIVGPSKTVSELMHSLIDAHSDDILYKLATKNGGQAFASGSKLSLVAAANARHAPVVSRRRHGLSERDVHFYNARYRFMTEDYFKHHIFGKKKYSGVENE
jgi:hypothetical protein